MLVDKAITINSYTNPRVLIAFILGLFTGKYDPSSGIPATLNRAKGVSKPRAHQNQERIKTKGAANPTTKSSKPNKGPYLKPSSQVRIYRPCVCVYIYIHINIMTPYSPRRSKYPNRRYLPKTITQISTLNPYRLCRTLGSRVHELLVRLPTNRRDVGVPFGF